MAPDRSKRRRENIFYLLILLIGVATTIGVAFLSGQANAHGSLPLLQRLSQGFGTFTHFVAEHAGSHFGLLLLQVLVILVVARSVAWLFMRMGQPTVIGEIIAGILLGPSVLGLFFPTLFSTLFPANSLGNISLLSQFGLILFMFVIGMELEISEIQKYLRKTIIISHTGIVIPFVLGCGAAWFLFEEYGTPNHSFLPFALFIGIAMSITAFPVLARIVQEKGYMGTHVGMLSLACAASGDITAWCLIAVVMAISQAGSATSALFTILFAVLYMVVMFAVVRPLFRLVGKVYDTNEVVSKPVIAMIFVTLLTSAYITEVLGLHALFGAFVAGVIMPEDSKFRRILTEKVEDVSLSIFLPLFFVASGLQTQIGLLNTWQHWVVTLLLIAIAVVGKLGGSYISARVVGETPRNSLYIGILMNTRGLMELIVLSMGYSLGILSPSIYAILVLMTIVTTVMTPPLMELAKAFLRRYKQAGGEGGSAFRIFFAFGRPNTAIVTLHIIESFFAQKRSQCNVTGMHMTLGTETNPVQADHFHSESFRPLTQYVASKGWNIQQHYEVTDDLTGAIVRQTAENQANLLLVGAGVDLSHLPKDKEVNRLRQKYKHRFGIAYLGATSLFATRNLLADKSEAFIQKANCPVGIIVDRGLQQPAQRILVVHDATLPAYTQLVQLLRQGSPAKWSCIQLDTLAAGNRVGQQYQADTLLGNALTAEVLQGYDLLLISYPTWKQQLAADATLLHRIPTTLLLAPHA